MNNHKGMTLIEILVACALSVGVFLGVSSMLSNMAQFNSVMDKKTEAFSDLSLMRLNLSKRIARLFYNPLFLNETILSALALPDMTFDYPNKGGYFSIIPFKGKALIGLSGSGGSIADLKVVEGNSQIDLFLMLGPDRESSLTVLPKSDGTEIYDFTDPATAGGALEVKETRSGSGDAFEVGNLVALSTDQGTQILRVSNRGSGTLEFVTMGPCSTGFSSTTMPLGLIYAGALIEKVKVLLLAVDRTNNHLYFLDLNENGRYDVLAKVTRAVQSMRVYNMKDNDYFSWDLAPLSNLGYLVVEMEPVTIGNQTSRAEKLTFPF